MTNLLKLLHDLSSEAEEVRTAAAKKLEDAAAPTERELAAIANLLESPVKGVAYWAATLLGKAGAAADHFAPELRKLAQHAGELPAREQAVWALGKLGPQARTASRELLTKLASEKSPRLARLAKQALREVL